MSVLDSSIAQILDALDQRRRKRIDYISQQPAPVRAALLIPDDTTDPTNATRTAALLKLAVGFPGLGYQIDKPIMIDGGDPLTTMQTRQQAGREWVLPVGIDDPALAVDEDQQFIPIGAIIVTTDFDTPAVDLVVTGAAPFKWAAIKSTGADPKGVGSAWWPLQDTSPELSVWYGQNGCKYQKLSVQYGNSGGFQLLWVRLS